MPHSLDREAMRRARLAHGWSLRQLSAVSGLSHGTVANAENGKFVPHPENIKALAAALDLEYDDLLIDGA